MLTVAEGQLKSEPDSCGVAPCVSVLCVTHNRRDLLLKCLQSCSDQDWEQIELVIVDNASTDGTAQAVSEAFPNATLIKTHRNIGFFPALNLAIANSSGALLMTVDDDAYFLDDCAFRRMVAELETDPSLAGVTCNIEGPYEAPLAEKDGYVPSFKTGFAMLRRKVFTDWVGYYPDAFFRSGGEEYVSAALWDMGHGLKRLSSVRMYHEQTAVGRSKWHWAFYGYRSAILVTLMRDPWYAVPARLASKFFSGLRHVLHKRSAVGLAGWLAAWCNVWLHLPYAIRLRRPISWETFRRMRNLRPTR